MSFLKKIFRDRNAAKPPAAVEEPSACTPVRAAADGQRKSVKCDICSTVIDKGIRIANLHFRTSIEQGFNPLGTPALRARMQGFVRAGAAKGLTEAQMTEHWEQGALADGTDWVLCNVCHSDYAAATERKNRAFNDQQFWTGIGKASVTAQGSGKTIPLDSLSLLFREALEEILAERLNAGKWDSLVFSQWGTKPYLPGEMVFSLDMAERPNSGGLGDAYIVFTGGGEGVAVLLGVPKGARMTVDEAKARIIEAMDQNQVYTF